MQNGKVELRKGREVKEVPIEPLSPERSKPIAYMVEALRSGKPVEGMVGLGLNDR